MKLPVRDFLARSRWGELDTETGAIVRLAADAAPAGNASAEQRKERGYFAQLGEIEVALFADAGKLLVAADSTRFGLSDISVDVAGEELRTLRLSRAKADGVGEVVMRVSYPNPINPPMDFDLTMAEEEDFDLGIFIKNVAASSKRCDLMLAKWS